VGTRGFVGFIAGGRELIAYNHAGSYPEHLGLSVLGWLRDGAVNYAAAVDAGARRLRLVMPGTEPTSADVARLHEYADTLGGTKPPGDWHSLLRGTQGSPALMLQAGVIEDASGFPAHPAARWGYLIDLDARAFEVYQGGRLCRHDRGRFAKAGPTEIAGHVFWPVALVASWPFAALPSDDAFQAACYGPEADG
jgi:hypothetical protein